MSVQLVQQTVELPKESKEVKDVIVDIVKKLKAGMKIQELAIAEFAALEQAISGYQALPEEMKDPHIYMLAGIMAGEIVAALKG